MNKTTKKTKELIRETDEVLQRDISDLLFMAKTPAELKQALELQEQFDKIKENRKWYNKISPNTWALVVGNLIGISLILSYESRHVLTSKALGFVLRGRV